MVSDPISLAIEKAALRAAAPAMKAASWLLSAPPLSVSLKGASELHAAMIRATFGQKQSRGPSTWRVVEGGARIFEAVSFGTYRRESTREQDLTDAAFAGEYPGGEDFFARVFRVYAQESLSGTGASDIAGSFRFLKAVIEREAGLRTTDDSDKWKRWTPVKEQWAKTQRSELPADWLGKWAEAVVIAYIDAVVADPELRYFHTQMQQLQSAEFDRLRAEREAAAIERVATNIDNVGLSLTKGLAAIAAGIFGGQLLDTNSLGAAADWVESFFR